MPLEEKLAIVVGAKFEPLSEAETRVLGAAETGDKAECGTGLSAPGIRDEQGSCPRSVRAAILRWLIRDRTARERVDPQGIRIVDALVTGELDLTAMQVPFPLSFERCTFDSKITLRDAEVRNLEFSGSELLDIAGDRLVCRGGISLDEGCKAHNEVGFIAARIDGDLACRDSRFSGLSLDACEINGSVYFDHGFVSNGTVELRGAVVRGDLACRGGHFEGPKADNADDVPRSDAIDAGGITVGGNAYFDEGFLACGAVFLSRAKIDGGLHCDGGKFFNPGHIALSAFYASVGKEVRMGNGFVAEGVVDLSRAKIDGGLDCDGGKFFNPGHIALSAIYASVGNEVRMGNGFVAEGDLDFEAARIDGDLSFVGATANKTKPQEGERLRFISFVSASIRGDLLWMEVDLTAATDVLFTNARIDSVVDEPKSWPKLGRLDLRGMTYIMLRDMAAVARLEWLRLQGPERFSLQPYEEFIAWARRNGRAQDAVRVAIARQDDIRRYGQISPIAAAWNWFLGKSMAHGYEPLRVVYVAAVFIFIGWAVFGYGAAHGVMLPSKLEGKPAVISDTYQALSPLMYSIDTFLPIIDFHQESYWLPNPSTALGRGIRIYLWFHIGMGWALTTLAVIGFTGLVRKT
jgi:hypothetical protein